MAKLNSTEIQQRLGAAVQAEQEAAEHLRRVSTVAVLADMQGSAEEIQARTAHANATAAVSRLSEALDLVRASEANNRVLLANARVDAEDAACLKAVQDFAVAGDRAEAAIAAYTKAYEQLLAAADTAEQWLTQVRGRGDVRADLIIPPCASRFKEQLSRVGQAPGYDPTTKTLGSVTGLDISLAAEIRSIAGAAINDLATAKARRDQKVQAVDEWSVGT